jgi:geranyl diphosphate synthase
MFRGSKDILVSVVMARWRTGASSRSLASLTQSVVNSNSAEIDTQKEIECVTERLRHSISKKDVPVLEKAAEYFFQRGKEGKRFRSSVVLLMATSLAPHGPMHSDLAVDISPPNRYPVDLRRRQQRIAEISELIHVASLLHDDVIDDSDSRRGLKALNTLLGNKVAILAGDFLLARASVSLASLHDHRVIALMSQILEDLVSGEILQMTSAHGEASSMDHYMKKTFYKTASLIANSCKSVAVLAGCDDEQAEAAWGYGKHLGLAFQLVDDVLDFTSSQEELGKPVGNDVRSGLATAPVLFAAQDFPELLPMIQRRFREPGDVSRALELVQSSKGIINATNLADHHAKQAVLALDGLPPSLGPDAEASRSALEAMTSRVTVERL